PEKSIFSYVHPYFWPLIESRKVSEEFMAYELGKHNKYNFICISGSEEMDKEIRKQYSNEYFKNELHKPAGTKPNKHLTLIGPYLVSSIFPQEISEEISTIFRIEKSFREKLELLQPIFARECDCKVMVE